MIRLLLVTAALFVSGYAAADEEEKKSDEKVKSSGFVTTDKTNIDFSETMIDGKMQAPSGFYLQGRQAQSMTQMVRLRSKFRSELRNSKSAVKSISK
jgi:hypothetical protein